VLDELFPISGDLSDRPDPWHDRLTLLLVLTAAIPTAWAAVSFVAALIIVATMALGVDGDAVGLGMAFAALMAAVGAPLALGFAIYGALRPRRRERLLIVTEILWFGVLPVWGFAINASLPDCAACVDTNRAVAWPEGVIVVAGWALSLIAYVVSRRFPDPLGRASELLILLGLGVGVIECSALVLHFGPQLIPGFIFGPIGLPLVAPSVVVPVWALTAFSRLWRHPDAALVGGAAAVLLSAGATADLLVTRLVLGVFDLFGGALADTCGWTLSVRVPPPQDCHYLCTVAARGHPWLVRPLRLGKRRGHVIVVNRQLAVANAFEDLLHERWPRFGAGARRAYDRVGRPICRYLMHPLAADAVFLAMLPAQAAFELVLRALDRDPEARIDRMYR
jgi:hypothetical protein